MTTHRTPRRATTDPISKMPQVRPAGNDPRRESAVPPPVTPPARGSLPASLTFFMRAEERAIVLKKLLRLDSGRTRALLRVLYLRPHGTHAKPKGARP